MATNGTVATKGTSTLKRSLNMLLYSRKILPSSIFYISYRDRTNYCKGRYLFIVLIIHCPIQSTDNNNSNNLALLTSVYPYCTEGWCFFNIWDTNKLYNLVLHCWISSYTIGYKWLFNIKDTNTLCNLELYY